MTTFLAVLGAVMVLLALMFAIKRLERARVARRFQSIYMSLQPRPTLEFSGNYGFPSFSVLFKTKEELEAAEASGLNRAFREFISNEFRNFSSNEQPFYVEQALSFIYEGYISEVVARINSTQVQGRGR